MSKWIRCLIASFLCNRGEMYGRRQQPQQALASFDRALKFRPDYAAALTYRGRALLELKRPREALVSLNRALAQKPDCAHALYYRGNAHLNLRQLEDALASYELAIRLNPHFPDALYNRGLALEGAFYGCFKTMKLFRGICAEKLNCAVSPRPVSSLR